jgi:predicted CXXCH cytochrome family protein
MMQLKLAGSMIVRIAEPFRVRPSRAAAVVLLVAAGAGPTGAQTPSGNPQSAGLASRVTIEHHAKCSSCHGSEGVKEEDLRHVGNRTVRRCTSCHTGFLDPSGSDEGAKRWGHVTGRRYDRVPLSAALSGQEAGSLDGRQQGELECLSCHEHHPNDRPYQLRMVEEEGEPAPWAVHLDPISQSCLCCHPDASRFKLGRKHLRHPVGIRATVRRQREEPLPLVDRLGTAETTDDVIGCTTCHYAHTGPNPDILRWTPEEQSEACCICHDRGPGRLAGADSS